MPSNPPADENDTGVLHNLYSENPPEKGFRPYNGCGNMIEIEDEDHQRDESSASDCSEMPSLLSHHGLDDSSDDSIDARSDRNESQNALHNQTRWTRKVG